MFLKMIHERVHCLPLPRQPLLRPCIIFDNIPIRYISTTECECNNKAGTVFSLCAMHQKWIVIRIGHDPKGLDNFCAAIVYEIVVQALETARLDYFSADEFDDSGFAAEGH